MFVALAIAHGVALVAAPASAFIAIGVWWNSNTISHNFIHRPFFPAQLANRLFSAYLSVLLGIPQALWRERHLAHHAATRWQLRLSAQLVSEVILVTSLWAALTVLNPRFFATVYLPGYLAGLALCSMQGHYEHARGATSHYGPLYNFLFFNDGYHAEHHASPGVHWSRLPERVEPAASVSRWPAVLRMAR